MLFLFHVFYWYLRGGALIAKPIKSINLTPRKGRNRWRLMVEKPYPFLSETGGVRVGISHVAVELPFCRLSGCLLISMAISGHLDGVCGRVLSLKSSLKRMDGDFRKTAGHWKKNDDVFFWMCKRVESVKLRCLKCNFEDHSGSFLWYCNFDCKIHPNGCWGEVRWRRVEAFMTQVGIDAGKS